MTDRKQEAGWSSGSSASVHKVNCFVNGKTQMFNSGGVVKWAYFPKKWSIPLNPYTPKKVKNRPKSVDPKKTDFTRRHTDL